MRIIGCDLHARQQTIAMLDRDTGEISERMLTHDGTTVRDFYASLPPPVVVGIEATGTMGWFVRMMRQKHDRRDTRLLLDLLSTDRMPSIWMPPLALWDLRALLRHRDQWVRLRTRVKNALQGLALAHGIRRRAGLWSRSGQATLAALPLPRYTGQRRSELQALHAHLTTLTDALDHQVSEAAQQRHRRAG
jgi:transposase